MRIEKLWSEIRPVVPSFSVATVSGTAGYFGARLIQDSFHIIHAHPSFTPEQVTSMAATLVGLFAFAVVGLFTTPPSQ